MVRISHCISLSNHQVVHLKNMQFYFLIINLGGNKNKTVKKEKKKRKKMDLTENQTAIMTQDWNFHYETYYLPAIYWFFFANPSFSNSWKEWEKTIHIPNYWNEKGKLSSLLLIGYTTSNISLNLLGPQFLHLKKGRDCHRSVTL